MKSGHAEFALLVCVVDWFQVFYNPARRLGSLFLLYTLPGTSTTELGYPTMHYDAHQPVLDDLEARILTIRDSL